MTGFWVAWRAAIVVWTAGFNLAGNFPKHRTMTSASSAISRIAGRLRPEIG